MSGSIEKRESGASERPGSSDRILTWHKSKSMLPLIRRIALDVRGRHERLGQLYAELAHLEKNRRTLDWPQRQRRYQLEDEVAGVEAEVRALATELETLGVALLDGSCGMVGFPTRVNDRLAHFSWMPGEEELSYWCYAGDHKRRPVPHDWTLPNQPRPRSRKSKK